jgi:tetratricopeptide (TPR) repeat protein
MRRTIFLILISGFTATLLSAQTSNQLFDEAVRLAAAGKCPEALPLFTKVTKQTPYFYQAYYEAGRCQLNSGKKDLAIKSFSEALDVYPEYYDALVERGRLLGETGKEKDALADFSKAISLKPGRYEAYSARAALHEQQGRIKNATEDLNTAIGCDAGNGTLYYRRGMLLEASNKTTAAAGDYLKAGQLSDNADAWYRYAVLKSAAGEHRSAIEAYSKAVAAGKRTKELFEGRARAYYLTASFAEAQKDFTELIATYKSGTADNYYFRGMCYHRTGNPEAAMKDLNRSVSLNPALDSALVIMAVISAAQGKVQQAQIYYTRAINTNQSCGTAYAGRAGIYFEQKKYLQALADYDMAVKLAPSGEVLYHRAMCHDAMGNRKAACTDLQAASLLGNKEADKKKESYCR